MVNSHCGGEGGEHDSKDIYRIIKGELYIQNVWNNWEEQLDRADP